MLPRKKVCYENWHYVMLFKVLLYWMMQIKYCRCSVKLLSETNVYCGVVFSVVCPMSQNHSFMCICWYNIFADF